MKRERQRQRQRETETERQRETETEADRQIQTDRRTEKEIFISMDLRKNCVCCLFQQVLQKLLERQMPMLPRINFPMVDVRDVAEAHVRAMTLPEAAGTHCCSSLLFLS